MPFTANIPQPGDLISDSQSQLLDNNQTLSTVFNVNHTDFNAADPGKHKFVSMPEQVSSPATLANEMALYTKESSISGVAQSELFWRRESSGSEIPMTARGASGNFRYSYTASGVLIKRGTVNVTTGTLTTITLPSGVNIPAFTSSSYDVILTGVQSDPAWLPICTVNPTPTGDPINQFNVMVFQTNGATGNVVPVNVVAIGF